MRAAGTGRATAPPAGVIGTDWSYAYYQARKLGYSREEWLRASPAEWRMILDGSAREADIIKEA